MYSINESDWKLFRKRLPNWQEAFMEKLVDEYMELLSGPGEASKKFWKLEGRIKSDRRLPGVVVESMSRSHMIDNLAYLMLTGAITETDLDGFSKELRGRILKYTKIYELHADDVGVKGI